MTENELTVGRPRVGWFLDGDRSTPPVGVMLDDTGEQVVVSVPTGVADDPYGRWFSGAMFVDDPDRTKFSYAPPNVTMFKDADGPVVLVGCRAAGHREREVGVGRIVANFAVLGGTNLGYDTINGLRSEIPALARWTGWRSLRTKSETDPDGRVQRMQVTLDSPPEIELSDELGLRMRPSWRTSYPDNIGTFAAHEVAQVSTSSATPVPWHDHIRMHQAIRELLALAAWRPLGFLRLEAMRHDDSIRYEADGPIHPRWAPVVTRLVRRHEAWTTTPRFLFTFAELGTAGVAEWLSVRRRFDRTVRAMVGIADGHIEFIGERMLQAGMALEALGYQLDVDSGGKNLNARNELPFPSAVDVVLDHLVHVPLPDARDWKRRVIACYKAVKHPDNPEPDFLMLANTMRETLLVLRAWLAGRLGCSAADLSGAFQWDPMRHEYFSSGDGT